MKSSKLGAVELITEPRKETAISKGNLGEVTPSLLDFKTNDNMKNQIENYNKFLYSHNMAIVRGTNRSLVLQDTVTFEQYRESKELQPLTVTAMRIISRRITN